MQQNHGLPASSAPLYDNFFLLRGTDDLVLVLLNGRNDVRQFFVLTFFFRYFEKEFVIYDCFLFVVKFFVSVVCFYDAGESTVLNDDISLELYVCLKATIMWFFSSFSMFA